mgnify:CR=1 FL=1
MYIKKINFHRLTINNLKITIWIIKVGLIILKVRLAKIIRTLNQTALKRKALKLKVRLFLKYKCLIGIKIGLHKKAISLMNSNVVNSAHSTVTEAHNFKQSMPGITT